VASRLAHIRLVIAAEAVLLGLRTRAFDHIHKLSLADHNESRRGVLVSRVTSDVESLAQFTQWGAISWVINSSIIVGALLVMLVYNWQLTLVVVACHLPLLPFLKWVQKRQFNAYSLVRTRVAETLGQTSEAVTGAPVIRAYGYDEPVRARLDEAIDNQYRSQMRSVVWFAGLLPVVDFFSSLSLAAVVGVGVWYSDVVDVGVGELVAFLFLVNLLLNPIAELGEVLDQTQTALAGWWKILRVLDVPIAVEEPEAGAQLPSGPLAITVAGAGFRYRTGEQVLYDVDVEIPAETNVAIVGETGSGKTTFARLLARLADPVEGVVTVGGLDLRSVDPESRRAAIRMVPQDGFLFDTTIEENICFGRIGATRAEAEASVEELGLTPWLSSLPLGIDTPGRWASAVAGSRSANDSSSPWPGPRSRIPGYYSSTKRPRPWIRKPRRPWHRPWPAWRSGERRSPLPIACRRPSEPISCSCSMLAVSSSGDTTTNSSRSTGSTRGSTSPGSATRAAPRPDGSRGRGSIPSRRTRRRRRSPEGSLRQRSSTDG